MYICLSDIYSGLFCHIAQTATPASLSYGYRAGSPPPGGNLSLASKTACLNHELNEIPRQVTRRLNSPGTGIDSRYLTDILQIRLSFSSDPIDSPSTPSFPCFSLRLRMNIEHECSLGREGSNGHSEILGGECTNNDDNIFFTDMMSIAIPLQDPFDVARQV